MHERHPKIKSVVWDRDQLKRQYNLGRFWLDVQLDDVASFDEVLAEKLTKMPAEYLPLVRLIPCYRKFKVFPCFLSSMNA